MATRDGNGWTRCGQGHRHWGRHGAAGLLAYASSPGSREGRASPDGLDGPSSLDGPVSVLLQLRSGWGHHGGTWGLPGGAMDSHESVVAAALREAAEECGIEPEDVEVRGILRDDHASWSYWTVIGWAATPFCAYPASAETSEVAWVSEAEVGQLALHPGFAAQWPVLRQALRPLTIIVDVANVMGSRPDGWWRDRAGAASRLRDQLAVLAVRGVAALPDSMSAPAVERWFPNFVLVVEGAARVVAAGPVPEPGRRAGDVAAGGPGGLERLERPERLKGLEEPEGPERLERLEGLGTAGLGRRVRVTAAAGSGDDTIAELAGELAGRRLVVTADRELRRRCAAAGASVAGPGWLLGLL
jgi:8-oxo-dGTP diphosphatase